MELDKQENIVKMVIFSRLSGFHGNGIQMNYYWMSLCDEVW